MIDRMSGRTKRVQPVVQPRPVHSRQTTSTPAPSVSPSVTILPKQPLQNSIRELVGTDLLRVESMLTDILSSQYSEVNDLASRAASLGGKRLRPSLALLSALAANPSLSAPSPDDTIRVAVTVELVHAASLVHDDVLDNATLRRHQPTIHSQVGPHRSIVLGDFLFTRAYGLAAQCRSTHAARNIAAAASELCEGELRQQNSVGHWMLSESDYLDILRQKTGELCAVSCRLGAWSGRGASGHVHALSRFGRKLGVAFQVVDDWLDLWGTEQVGKTLGTDLLQRKPTLPVIRLLAIQTQSRPAALVELLEGSPQSSEVREMLDNCDASAYCLDLAGRLINSAMRDLHQLHPSPARSCLEGIAQQCIRRTA